VFVIVVLTLNPIASYAASPVSIPVLVALLVCLIPTTIGALLSAIGIAGMDRLVQRNVLAMSGRAVEAAGDVTTLLLDKTGTITYGNRRASEFLPLTGVDGASSPRRRAVVARRPDARGRVDRRARRRAASRRSPRTTPSRAVHRADPHERSRPGRRHRHPQGRRQRRARGWSRPVRSRHPCARS
jgi:P-type E1-E2 ATPase